MQNLQAYRRLDIKRGHETGQGSASLGWSTGHVLVPGLVLGVSVPSDCPLSAAVPREVQIPDSCGPEAPLTKPWEEEVSAYNPTKAVQRSWGCR